MRRALLVAVSLAWIGCDTSVCRGVDGTCVALTVDGIGSVDSVVLTLSGAVSGQKVAPRTAEVHALPVEIALAVPNASGALHIDAVGVLLGHDVGAGSTDVTLTQGAHVSGQLLLTPGGDVTGGGSDGGSDGGGGPIDVTGTRVRHYVLGDGGVVAVPTDFTSNPIAALVQKSDASWAKIAGTGDANGNFTLHVTSAPYYLRYYSSDTYGAAMHPDLGYWTLGRPDQTNATSATTLSFNVSGLSPWSANDTLEFLALNAGTGVFGVENFLMPGAGATTLGGSFDLSKMTYGNLIDAAKGDDAFLIQLVGDTSSGTPYQRLAKIANFAPFTIANGGSQSLTTTMTDVPQSGSLSIAWSRSQFTQYKSAVNLAVTAVSDTFDVFPQPGGVAHGAFSSTPDVLTARPAAGNSDVAMTMSYGNPFPSSWPLVTYTGSAFSMSYTAVGATAKTFDGYVAVYSTLAQLPSPIVPLVSPVQSPTIDGNSAAIGQLGISATPVIAWSAPALGTPSTYAVYLYAIDNVAGATSLDFIDELYTKSTSITIPPGLLAGGQRYFVDITAFVESTDRTVTPFQSSLPAGFADALSGPFTIGFPSTNPTSCKALLAAQPGLPDGIYIIDPDGSGAAPPVNVWCDMTTAGGGWTLCAWSKDPSAETTTWAPIDAAQSSNWYACHKYSTTPVDAMVRVANAATSYSNRFANVDFKPGSADSQYKANPATAPNLVLDLLPNEGACATASPGNLQWDIQTAGSLFGQNAKNGCSSGTASVFIGSSGAHTNGCWGNNQISPQIGYPCGGFGNFGVHLELWAR